ncbi:helix-turn-helix domain-containing protein [Marinoscillum luteum]|uniref:Helix-turn-helix domain-containing protein n=1 Tax=Marinoscillum luteum TaxID=861051 RepID=A0ABW7N5D8_9BACT
MNDLDIKKIRRAYGITQQELADKLDVSLKTVQNYEAGRKIPDKMKQLVRYSFPEKGNSYVQWSQEDYNQLNVGHLLSEINMLKEIKKLQADKIKFLELEKDRLESDLRKLMGKEAKNKAQ